MILGWLAYIIVKDLIFDCHNKSPFHVAILFIGMYLFLVKLLAIIKVICTTSKLCLVLFWQVHKGLYLHFILKT